MAEIKAVTEFGERPSRCSVWEPMYRTSFEHGGGEWPSPEGGGDILRFEETTRPGQSAHIPWIIAHHRDGSTTEFNATLLASIERAPDAETAEGEET